MLTLISPIPTLWHRKPAGLKLALLFVFMIGLFAITSLWLMAAALGLVIALYACAGRRFIGHGLRQMRPLLLFILIVGLWHLYSGSPELGGLIVLRLLAGVAAANLVTLTTKLSDMIAVLERVLTPLRKIGIKPRIIALAVALMIRFIPVMLERMAHLHEAWRARSPRRISHQVILPATLAAFDDADHVAEALRARGGVG